MKQGVDLTGFSLQRLFVKLSILCVNGELHKAPLAVQMRTELDVLFVLFFSILYCKSIWRTGRLE